MPTSHCQIYIFLIGCPLLRRKCLGVLALSITEHTDLKRDKSLIFQNQKKYDKAKTIEMMHCNVYIHILIFRECTLHFQFKAVFFLVGHWRGIPVLKILRKEQTLRYCYEWTVLSQGRNIHFLVTYICTCCYANPFIWRMVWEIYKFLHGPKLKNHLFRACGPV